MSKPVTIDVAWIPLDEVGVQMEQLVADYEMVERKFREQLRFPVRDQVGTAVRNRISHQLNFVDVRFPR